LDGNESAWVGLHLAKLRALEPVSFQAGGNLALAELKHIYMRARVIQGSIVASRLALPAAIGAGQIVRTASLPKDLGQFVKLSTGETERYLTGADNGKPRQGNDYPATVKVYISALAGLLDGPYNRAYIALRGERPDLLAIGWDADELQRLAWGHIRRMIDDVIPAEEVARYRQKSLREGTDRLLAVVRERTGVNLPARIMQRDDWLAALKSPRQEANLALFNAMRFFVENAEIAILYCIGSLLVRIRLGKSPKAALENHIRYGAQEIAAGTHILTHKARFQSRLGARPNYRRSFEEFLRNVREQMMRASLQPDGNIAWSDLEGSRERGWCPAQNKYEPQGSDNLEDLAKQGHAAIEAWKEYGQTKFGVQPIFARPTPAELFGSVALFATVHENSPLRPDHDLVQDLARQL
jgi:hypothetical protein